MVEMTETANILHNATERSLVLVDEIGRGTSTFDGLALAWAVAEDLANRIGAFTLFATHYFELTVLPDRHPGIVNVHLEAIEHGERIVFLHRVKDGPASQSYGLQVAQLAGVPRGVISQARERLGELERRATETSINQPQLGLFDAPAPRSAQEPQASTPAPDPLREAVEALDPDATTPREALQALYRLRSLADDNQG